MSHSILIRMAVVPSRVSDTQTQVDTLVSNFVEESLEPRTLISLTAGSLAYRFGKISVMKLGIGAYCNTPLRLASIGFGLTSEVTTFELTNRFFHTFRAHGRAPLQNKSPNLWSLSGPGGLQEGLLHSFLTFGILKGGGVLAQEENEIVRHVFQSAALVTGQNLAGQLHLAPKPVGSLPEQLLQAESTNLQLGASLGLLNLLAPEFNSWERSLDLMTRSEKRMRFEWNSPPFPFSLATASNPVLSSPAMNSPEKNHGLILMSPSGLKGGNQGGSYSSRAPRILPIRSPEKNEDIIRQEEHLEKLAQEWRDRLHPDKNSYLVQKVGGPLTTQEISEKIPPFLKEHRELIETIIAELRKKENRSHPDHDVNLATLKEILYRIEGMVDMSQGFEGVAPNWEELKDFFTTLYRGANVLVGLSQASTYDPIFLNDALDHYHEALLDWHGTLHPEREYELIQTPWDTHSEQLGPRMITKDSKTEAMIRWLFGPRISPRHFAEAYADLSSLSFCIAQGKLFLDGEKWDAEGETKARVSRIFSFQGGHWTVSRSYEFVPPTADIAMPPVAFRPEAWEIEETQARLEKELALYDQLGVERIFPGDVPLPWANIPFASLDWLKKRLSLFLEAHLYTVPYSTLIHIKEPYEIAHLLDEKTKAPVGAEFLRWLNLEWEGILSLPPHYNLRRRFENYYEGRRALEQRNRIEGRMVELKEELKKNSPNFKSARDQLISLYQYLSQQMALRSQLNLGWSSFHTLREHKSDLQSLKVRFKTRKGQETLRKEIEKGIELLERALRIRSLSGEAPSGH